MKKFKVFNGFYFDDDSHIGKDEPGFDTLEEAREDARKLARKHQSDYVIVEAKYKVSPETQDIKIVEEEIV